MLQSETMFNPLLHASIILIFLIIFLFMSHVCLLCYTLPLTTSQTGQTNQVLAFLASHQHQTQETAFLFLYTNQTNPSGRSGLSLQVNANVHWGQLKYLSSTTSQPNIERRTEAPPPLQIAYRDTLQRGKNKSPMEHKF